MGFKPQGWHMVLAAIYGTALIGVLSLAIATGKRPPVKPIPTPAPVRPTPALLTPEPTEIESNVTPKPTPPITWTELFNGTNGITIMYPDRFDMTCCTIQGPSYGAAIEIAVLADPLTVASGTDKPFDGVGFFIANQEKLPFEEYMIAERSALLNDYQQWSFEYPDTTDYTTTIDGVTSELLVGYNYYGIWYTYVPLPDGEVLVIAKSNARANSFDSLYQQIIERINLPD